MTEIIEKGIGSYIVDIYKCSDNSFAIGFKHWILDYDECSYCEIFLYKDEIKKLIEFLKEITT